MARILGFNISRNTTPPEKQRSYIDREYDDGAMPIQAGGVYGQYYDVSNGAGALNDANLINRYRQMAQEPECETAIDEIVNEAVTMDQNVESVDIDTDRLTLSDSIKKKIHEEFKNVLKLISFNYNSYDIFRQWYIDGRLAFEKKIDQSNKKKGIIATTLIDPRKLKKVREQIKEKDASGIERIVREEEHFLYNPIGYVDSSMGSNNLIKFSGDSITYITSGLKSLDNKNVLSYLHKAIKPLNQLKMLEDAIVIYRISRAPERRIFYVDIGNLPKMKAEQYLNSLMNRYKSKLVYDTNTGELKDEKRHMSMLEDYWMPRREGGRGTEVQTLPGGQNLGELEDIQYFQKKLYKALNVPNARLENDNSFTMGRATEITRDEIKFNRFISRLRMRFSHLFDDMLKTQLVLKGVIKLEDWSSIRNGIQYIFAQDSHFRELKKVELLQERMNMLRDASEYMGNFFSKEWIYKNILMMNEQQIDQMKKQMKKEESAGDYSKENENMYNSFNPNIDNQLDNLSEEEYYDESKEEEQEERNKLLKNLNNFLENE